MSAGPVWTLPAEIIVQQLHFRIVPHARGHESVFTRQTDFALLDGARWRADLQCAPAPHAKADAISGALHGLDGPVGCVGLGDRTRPRTRGPAAGGAIGTEWEFTDQTRFTDGEDFRDSGFEGALAEIARRRDAAIVVGGLVASTVGALLAGDLIQIGNLAEGGQLVEVARAANADAQGASRVDVRPRLRRDWPAGTVLYFRNARGRFRLAGEDQAPPARVPVNSSRFPLLLLEIVD